MYVQLIKYIEQNSAVQLNNDEIQIINNNFIPKKFRRRQFLLHEGEVCKYVAFILKGAMRQYSIDEKGKEHIVGLCIENWWAGDRESFTKESPSGYFIDAWENTDVLMISKNNLVNLAKSVPAAAELSKILDERQAIALLKRINSAISYSAEQRLADLEKTYPEFLQRFPQHIIASYLGMTKETLSRIRSTGLKK